MWIRKDAKTKEISYASKIHTANGKKIPKNQPLSKKINNYAIMNQNKNKSESYSSLCIKLKMQDFDR